MTTKFKRDATKKISRVFRSPISLQSRAKRSESSEFCSCDRGATTAEPNDSLSHQPTPSFQEIESPVFMDVIVETDSEAMQENMEALLQQLARLTDEMQGEQLQEFIAEQKKLVDTQHTVNQNQGTGNARLDKFTADKQQDVGSWFDTFDCFAAFNNWTDERKVTALPLFLDGSAKTFYSGLPPETKANYQQTADAFRQRFGAEILKFLERQELSNHKMQPDEDLESYIDYVRRKSLRLNLSLEDRLHSFVQNLTPAIKENVILGNPQTYDEAEQLARLKGSLIHDTKQESIQLTQDALAAVQSVISARSAPAVAAAGVTSADGSYGSPDRTTRSFSQKDVSEMFKDVRHELRNDVKNIVQQTLNQSNRGGNTFSNNRGNARNRFMGTRTNTGSLSA